MCKATVLFLVGLSPFLPGWLLSLGMTTIFVQVGAWFYIVIGLTMLTLWMTVSGTLGFKGSKRGMAFIMLCINPPALMVLVLLRVQGLSFRAYWDNAADLLTQFFYLPSLRLDAIVAMQTGQVPRFYFGAFPPLVLFS